MGTPCKLYSNVRNQFNPGSEILPYPLPLEPSWMYPPPDGSNLRHLPHPPGNAAGPQTRSTHRTHPGLRCRNLDPHPQKLNEQPHTVVVLGDHRVRPYALHALLRQVASHGGQEKPPPCEVKSKKGYRFFSDSPLYMDFLRSEISQRVRFS